ncbi:MAG: hypothetical protein EBR82_15740, partial [Caulobacteraceae bacterium]|nr:hypothetical protein [Caulobacteraceae bacterium]
MLEPFAGLARFEPRGCSEGTTDMKRISPAAALPVMGAIAARTEVNKARRTRVRTFLRKFQEA